ncbi:PHD-finger domain-containing protein [Xylariales sp. AK1849]|nr:PHD-finger domain-containing protein [Xylariales sp. AK1849]
MADTSSTRRSSRARTTQSQSQLSSATSSLSGRAERSARGVVKAGSPQKSTGSGSLSSEPPEDSTATTASTDDNPLLRRRSTRAREDERERDKQPKIELSDMAIASEDNEIQEDDEAVRCVCGYDDYPGLPPLDEDSKSNALKDAIDLETLFSIELTDDLAGFFVQCDVCKVWEHGLCMGIINEDLLPDDYYCELCRKDLHKIYTANNGQKYSIYLPLHRPSRATSRAASTTAKDGTKSPKPASERKTARQTAAERAQASAKRRSTMNSRDAAYDEEQLRRAIEISKKEEAILEDGESAVRRPKRGRDDDEEQPDIKRQRTNSKSPSPSGDQAILASEDDSDDESGLRNGSSKKSSRNAARTQREKAERDERREEQERKRAEAASKRKGRAERRRADGTTIESTIFVKVNQADVDMDVDSDPSEEMPLVARTQVNRTTESQQSPDNPPPSSQPVPDTPPALQLPVSSHKKKAHSQHKKKGRNQYTKDRDAHENEVSPARSMSRDVPRNQDEHGTTHARPATTHEGGSKHNSKSKGGMNSKITMTDLKRRAHNILEFITRTQVELANEPLSEKNSPGQAATEDSSGGDVPAIRVNGNKGSKSADESASISNSSSTTCLPSLKDFKEQSCIEMMDTLTRDLVKWQQEFTPS